MVKEGKGDCQNISLFIRDNKVVCLLNAGKLVSNTIFEEFLDKYKVRALHFQELAAVEDSIRHELQDFLAVVIRIYAYELLTHGLSIYSIQQI